MSHLAVALLSFALGGCLATPALAPDAGRDTIDAAVPQPTADGGRVIGATPDVPSSLPDAPTLDAPLDAPPPEPCAPSTLAIHGTALGLDLATLEVAEIFAYELCFDRELRVYFRDPAAVPPTRRWAIELRMNQSFSASSGGAAMLYLRADGSETALPGTAEIATFERDGHRWFGVTAFTLDGTDAGGTAEVPICIGTCL